MIAAAEYEFIRRLVYDRSRINLGPDKVELVSSRLQKRLRALKLDTIKDYCALLRSPGGDAELSDMLDVISTNVTDFFREPDHFDFLRDTVVPEWLETRRRGETFRFWSAACSSGEEPYTAAIVLSECFGIAGPEKWQISASDISTRMLDTARKGIYRQERLRLPQAAWLQRYFQKGLNQFKGQCRVKPELRERVQFLHVNLMEAPYPFTEKFHAIFCRNVMIYFDRNTQEQLVARLKQQLVPGGWLFVGHSESLLGADVSLKSVRPSIYRHVLSATG